MVKTYKHLYPKIYDFANLYRAHRLARRGGTRTQPEVATFEPYFYVLGAPVPSGQALHSPRDEDARQGAASARDRITQ
jgi:hypothetical protein